MKINSIANQPAGLTMKQNMLIRITYVYPPIPDRSRDWEATEEDWDLGMPIGIGATPFEAVKDLLERMENSLLLGACNAAQRPRP